MLLLILFLVVGSSLAYVSHDNLMMVSVHVGPYVFSKIPLFYVIIGSMLTGLVLSYVINLVPSISSYLALRGKENEIKKNKSEVLELTKRVHQLELDNEKLKHRTVAEPDDQNAL